MLLKNCRFIVTQNSKREILEKQDILIEGNKIIEIGKNLSKSGQVINCSNKIVLPGLINCHAHLGMHSLKGVCDDKELFDWLSVLKPLEEKLSKKKVFENTLQGLRESLFFGTTTVFDSYKYAEERVKAFENLGMRGVLSQTVKNKQDLNKAVSFVKGLQKNNLLTGALGVHSIYNSNEEILKEVSQKASKLNVLKKIHVAETRKERFDIQQQKKKLPIEYLKEISFLNQNTLLNHCIWITKGEIKLIASANSKVSHSPISNLKLSSGGVMPLPEMLEEKVIVGLGTDSVMSNNSLNMFNEMKITGLLHRHHKWNASVLPAQKILDLATIDSASVLGLEKEIGSLEKGKNADIITLNLHENLLPVNNLVSNLIFCDAENNLNEVIINGKLKLQNREFV